MEFLNHLYQWTDAFLIFFFRLTDIPILGYYIGCTALALFCVLVGQATIAGAFRANKRFIDRDNHEMVRMHNLSMKALVAKDKPSFKSCNRQANDAFGKVFFSQIALAVSSLWPVPFAVGWMQTRFLEVKFWLPVTLPGVGDHVGYLFTFLPIYVLVYLLFGKVKHRLPIYRNMAYVLAQYDNADSEQMIRISDLVERPATEDTSSL